MSVDAPVLVSTDWTGPPVWIWSGLYLIRSQAPSCVLATEESTCCNPVTHYNKACPFLWGTSLNCSVKEPVWASRLIRAVYRAIGVLNHSNQDSDPFFCLAFNTHPQSPPDMPGRCDAGVDLCNPPTILCRFADCDKPRYAESSHYILQAQWCSH